MALYHVQMEYRKTKTWYIEAETGDAVTAFINSGELEENYEPTLLSTDSHVQALGLVAGKISKKYEKGVVHIVPQSPEERN